MATVRDLSGNTNYLDAHIAPPGTAIDTTGLATEEKQDDMITAIGNIVIDIDTTGLATETTLEALLTAATSTNPVLVALDQADFEPVAASTAAVLGPTGAIGDYLAGVWLVPSSVSPGAVTIKDGGGAAVSIFAGGADSLLSLTPFFVPLGINSVAGAWTLTTLTGMSAIAVGDFT